MQGGGFFRLLDANGDGRLDRAELSKATVLIERLDQDKDGTVDFRELFGVGGPGGDMRGAGGDMRPTGQRRPDQGDPASDARPRRPAVDGEPRRSPPGDATPARPEGAKRQSDAPRGSQDFEETFRRMDRNKDDAIDRDEAPEKLRDNFDRIDTNGDGRLSIDELKKVFERRQ